MHFWNDNLFPFFGRVLRIPEFNTQAWAWKQSQDFRKTPFLFHSNVKGGLFWNNRQEILKNNNWKKDYEYVIVSIFLSKVQTNLRIPEFYAQAWVQKQSQNSFAQNHYSWVWAQALVIKFPIDDIPTRLASFIYIWLRAPVVWDWNWAFWIWAWVWDLLMITTLFLFVETTH